MSNTGSSPAEFIVPTASPWPSATMYPTASGTPTQSPYPTSTLVPSRGIPGGKQANGKLEVNPTYFPTVTSLPSTSYFPTASSTPTASPLPTSVTGDPGETAPGNQISPMTIANPTSTSYPTSPTTSPFPSTTRFPTASGTPTASPLPTTIAESSGTGIPATNSGGGNFSLSKYSYQKACNDFVDGPDQIDTELVFTYLAESRLTSVDFVTELEIQLLDHASAAALECSNSSNLKIHRLAYPGDESSSDATTCAKTHPGSKSCWVLQTRIYVTSDRGFASVAKYTVLMDIQEQLNKENLVSTSFKDLTFTQYLGPDPVNLSGTPIVTPQGSTAEGSDSLKWAAIATVGLAVAALLGFFGLVYYVRRKRREVAANHDFLGFGGDMKSNDEISLEVTELLSRSKARLREHPLVANNENFDRGSRFDDDLEVFVDEDPFRDGFFAMRGESQSSLLDGENRRSSTNQGLDTSESESSIGRVESQRLTMSSSTNSMNQQSRSTSSSGRVGTSRTSSQQLSSQRLIEDAPKLPHLMRQESLSRRDDPLRTSSSRHLQSRGDQPSVASDSRRVDEVHIDSEQAFPRTVEIDLLDIPMIGSFHDDPSLASSRRTITSDQPQHSLSALHQSRSGHEGVSHRLDQGGKSNRSSSGRDVVTHRSDHEERLHRSQSGREDGSHQTSRGERSHRSSSGREDGSHQTSRGERSHRSSSGREDGSHQTGRGERSHRSSSGREDGSHQTGRGERSHRSGSGHEDGSHQTGRGERSHQSSSGHEDGSHRTGRGERSHQSSSGHEDGSHRTGRGERSNRSSSGRDESYRSDHRGRSHRSSLVRDEGSYRSDRGERSDRPPLDHSEGASRRSEDASRRSISKTDEGSRRSTSGRGDEHSSHQSARTPMIALYSDPVELAKERMAIARSDAESRKILRSQSSSRLESSKFDNVEIV